jgi:hypothetical protein
MASCDPNPYDPITHPSGYKEGEQLKDKEGNPITVTYSGPKVFEGFNPPGYENDNSNPSGMAGIKGTVISGYEGTYTTDSRKYRLAKLLYECEKHLVMDSVIYHYLFIQRHTMVDNGAKNTFWSTEDLQHWDLTKNYDNDTSDGNDNSGYLTYEYGIEIMDKKTNGELIFNGSPSVWMNFIYSFPQLQQVLY